MRLLQYTIIIWMGLARAGEPFEPIRLPEPVEKPVVRPRPIEPIRPRIEPIPKPHPVVEPPYDPPHPKDPVLPKKPGYVDSTHGTGLSVDSGVTHKGQIDVQQQHEPSVPKLVQTYVSQHSELPEVLKTVELSAGTTVQEIRTQYLERVQKSFQEKGPIELPTVAVVANRSLLQNGVGRSFVEWMVSITDGLSFAEQLSQLPMATEVQKQQFSFSPEKKALYEVTKAHLVDSAQQLVQMVASFHEQYSSLSVMGKPTGLLSDQALTGIPSQIAEVQALLEKSMEQRSTLVALLCEKSPSYDESMLSAVIDPAPGLAAWKVKEAESLKQSATLVFASYETFITGFTSAANVREYVQKFIGPEQGKFASVQALVAALDKIGFILDSTNFWLRFRQKYSKSTIDTILDSLIKEYPDTYIPSKKFILTYCKLKRSFKSVGFFIPNYSQFLIDAKTLTIEQLARKYGQAPEFIKTLLNNTYEAVYVLQQTSEKKEARDLSAIITKIMLQYPGMTSDMIAQVVASENVPIQMLYRAETGLASMASGLKNELVTLQAQQFQNKLTSVSAELAKAEDLVSQGAFRAQLVLDDMIADNFSSSEKGTRLEKVLTGVLQGLQKAETSFEAVGNVKKALPATSPAGARYKDVSDQLNLLKQDTMKFGLQFEYEKAKAQQDKVSARLVGTLQDAVHNELFSYTKNYWTDMLSDVTTSLKDESAIEPDGGSNTTDALLAEIITKSALEEENESDYQACIWASNKMGMMESKLMCISALLKIKTTPLFLTGYKSALKDINADFLFLSTSRSVQKCLNVIAMRSLLWQKIKAVEAEIESAEKKNKDRGKSKSKAQRINKDV